jgi:hypothetical protein
MLNVNHYTRIRIPRLLEELVKGIPCAGYSDRITVTFRRVGYPDVLMARFSASATVGDFVQSVDRRQKSEIIVYLDGQVVNPDESLAAAVSSGTLEISQPPPEERRMVAYRGETSPTEFMAAVPISGRIRDLLEVAVRSGVPGVSVKIGTRFLGLDDPLKDVDERFTFVISSQRDPRIPLPRELDLVLVIDATGSMGDVMRAVHDSAYNIASSLRVSNRTTNLRFACVLYRDPVDRPLDIHEVHSFSPSLPALQAFLNDVRASGGGDIPEDYVGAIRKILELTWRPTAKRAIVWLADAPAHGHSIGGAASEIPRIQHWRGSKYDFC